MSDDRAARAYRLLLRLYPRRERDRRGAAMEETFLALRRRYLERGGPFAGLRCWAAAVADVVSGAVTARVRALGPRRGAVDGSGEAGIRSFGRDVGLAVRSLARRPVFLLAVSVTLALGIGANAAVFTVSRGLLLAPLPYEASDELVVLYAENPELGWFETDVNPADAWDWRARSETLEDLAVYGQDRLALVRDDAAPEMVSAVRGTPNLFDVLGVSPALGRGLRADDFGENGSGEVVLTHALWQRLFGGDPDVLLRTMRLDGVSYRIVGVLPPETPFMDARPDLFLPLGYRPADTPRDSHYQEAIGRLAPGATLDEARAELRGIAAALAESHPETNEGWTASVVSLREDMLGDIARRASLVLSAAVALVLLMVCVNVANLLLARGRSRGRELAVRAALGAGRRRLVREMMAESLVLSAVGGCLGLLLGVWGVRGIVSLLPSTMPAVFTIEVDEVVLLFVAGVTVASALLAGLLPALRSSRQAMERLRSAGRVGRERESTRFGGALVVSQTALAMVLLACSGLLLKSVAGMRGQDFGFDPAGVVASRVAPPIASWPEDADLRRFWRTVEERVRALPGVAAAGTTQSHPLMGSNWGSTVRLEGEPETERRVRTTYASPGLRKALGLRMLRGRWVEWADGPDAPRVAIVNEAFVEQYLGSKVDPLEARILGAEGGPGTAIVGVVEDFVERSVDEPPEPSWYLPAAQGARVPRTRSIVVRAAGGPAASVVPAVREAVWSVDPDLPLFETETMEGLIDRRVGGFSAIAWIMSVFGLLSLLLGAVGIYGVTAYATGRRRGEIGVRLALGAEGREVVRMVIREGAGRALLGLTLGVAAALLFARLLGAVLVGVEPADPVVFGAVVVLLAGVSLLGLWLPARRAARVDPVRTLAHD